MKYKLLGNTGIRVSELSLGAMTFGNEWGMGADKKESQKVFDAYVNTGGNFIDTANLYQKHESENYVGEFVKSERSNLVVASKYTLSEDTRVNRAGNHRKNMIESIDESLRRLDTEYLDLYYVHAWDFTVGEQELMKNLEYLVSSGKVLSIGLSDTPAYIAARCNTIAELRGWSEFAAYQVEYSLTERSCEREILPYSEQSNMMICAFAPLAAGLLSGKYLTDTTEKMRMVKGKSLRLSERNLAISAKVNELAQKAGCTPSQLALYWVMQQSPNMITLFGARTEKQCIDNLGVLDLQVDQEIMDELNVISAIELGYPHDFLNTDRVKQIVYGNQLPNIEFKKSIGYTK